MRKNWVHKARIECCGKGTIKELEYEKYIYSQLKIQKKSKKDKIKKVFQKAEQVKAL